MPDCQGACATHSYPNTAEKRNPPPIKSSAPPEMWIKQDFVRKTPQTPVGKVKGGPSKHHGQYCVACPSSLYATHQSCPRRPCGKKKGEKKREKKEGKKRRGGNPPSQYLYSIAGNPNSERRSQVSPLNPVPPSCRHRYGSSAIA